MNAEQRKELAREIGKVFLPEVARICDMTIKEVTDIITAHDTQPSGEPRRYIQPYANTNTFHIVFEDSGYELRSHCGREYLSDEVWEKKPVEKLICKQCLTHCPKVNALATRDPGKVEALIEAAKLVVERADLNDKGDFIVSEKRFDALAEALKGVSDGK